MNPMTPEPLDVNARLRALGLQDVHDLDDLLSAEPLEPDHESGARIAILFSRCFTPRQQKQLSFLRSLYLNHTDQVE